MQTALHFWDNPSGKFLNVLCIQKITELLSIVFPVSLTDLKEETSLSITKYSLHVIRYGLTKCIDILAENSFRKLMEFHKH